MRISTRGVYALEAMLALGSQPSGERVSIRKISEQTGLSDSYLEQIFALLKRGGLLVSLRGNRGGYYLARPASAITVGDIVRAAEGSLNPVNCTDPAAPGCERYMDCLSRPVWNLMEREIAEFVNEITLDDLHRKFAAWEQDSQMEFFI
ncbi:MAG: Rrf2 family transcriptional regulator [Eubacteriales bacterium]|nr:Rrf2 family transcriptional regulator [Eubacteriales bacterium]